MKRKAKTPATTPPEYRQPGYENRKILNKIFILSDRASARGCDNMRSFIAAMLRQKFKVFDGGKRS
jgi:hypothetical protein